MRARRLSTCPICRGPILVGQQIGKLGTWQHIGHIIERHYREASTAHTTPLR
jgi:hypothetical protein